MTRPEPDPTELICAACRRPVDERVAWTNVGGLTISTSTYLHIFVLPGTPEHEIVPIRVEKGDAVVPVYVCDFCTEPHPRWEFPARSFDSNPVGGTDVVMMDAWVACDACKVLVERSDWNAVSDRYATNIRNEEGPLTAKVRQEVRDTLRPLQLGFVNARTGPPKPI